MKVINLVAGILLACQSLAVAATPIFSMTPVNLPSIVVAGKTTVLSYTVTANVKQVMNQPNGVIFTALTPAVAKFLPPRQKDDCQANENFVARQSCVLNVLIDAANLQPGQTISGKPIFCNHPELAHPMYCSQPAEVVNIKVVSPDDPQIHAVTVTPNTVINIYPGEPQTLTVKNTSGDYVNDISVDIDNAADFIISNNCHGQLLQGATCTIVLATSLTPSFYRQSYLTIQANDYTPIKIPVYARAVNVLAGSYLTVNTPPTSGVLAEGLIWVKKTNWQQALPSNLANQPLTLFSVSHENNNWLITGASSLKGEIPLPPHPPFVFNLNDKPVILESLDSAQTFSTVSPNISLPENSVLLASNIFNNTAVLGGFHGQISLIFPIDPSKEILDFQPLAISRDSHKVWHKETVNLPSAGGNPIKKGAFTSLTSDKINNTDYFYAAGIAAIYPALWERKFNNQSNAYIWQELPYYDDISNAPWGTFFGVKISSQNLVAVGTTLNLNLAADLPLIVTGNYNATTNKWAWEIVNLTIIKNQYNAPSTFTLNELSSVDSNKSAKAGHPIWISVGYSVTIDKNSKQRITHPTPLMFINSSLNPMQGTWQQLDLSASIPASEAWELTSVRHDAGIGEGKWIAVGTRYNRNLLPLFQMQPLVIESLDGLHWTEVVDGFPTHPLNQLIPLIFAVK